MLRTGYDARETLDCATTLRTCARERRGLGPRERIGQSGGVLKIIDADLIVGMDNQNVMGKEAERCCMIRDIDQ